MTNVQVFVYVYFLSLWLYWNAEYIFQLCFRMINTFTITVWLLLRFDIIVYIIVSVVLRLSSLTEVTIFAHSQLPT